MSNLDWYRSKGLGRPAPPVTPREPPVFTGGFRTQQLAPANPAAPVYGAPPPGQVSVGGSLQYWKGSREAAQIDTGNCPRCGSGNYFASITSESAAGGKGGAAMGHCMACSYRGNHSVLTGPTMQTTNSFRGIDPGVPVKQSRQAKQPGFRTVDGTFGRSGGNAIIARVS